MKPLWAVAGVALLGTAGVAGALIVGSSGGEEEVLQQVETATPITTAANATAGATPTASLESATPSVTEAPVQRTPGPGETLWRWGSLTITIPSGSDVYVTRDFAPANLKPPNGGLAIRLTRDNPPGGPASAVLLDAESGSVLLDEVLEEDRAAIQSILQTVMVSPIDGSTAPWPYRGDPSPALERASFGGISYLTLPPETGLEVYTTVSDPGGASVGISNGYSGAIAYVAEGSQLLFDTTHVRSEDKAIFDQWLSTVKICGTEAAC